MPNKTVANLVINAPEFGMNDSFEIEDTAARATANAAASTAASTAATVQTMGTRLTAVETKNTQQDTAIANAAEAIAGKTQMYTTAGGVNTPYPQLRIGTGLSVDNGVLSATGGGGDISALTARVAALETNDGIQDTDIDNLQTAMTTAQGDIGALETNDGVQDTDIDDLQTRMSTAEDDIDGLEANDITLSMEKTGLYTNSGGTNSYYTDLALGSGLAVTNGVLDVVGGGGAGWTTCTAVADADTATTPGLYCPASTSATNFPDTITDTSLGTLIVSTFPTGDKVLIQQIYINNHGSNLIWTRTYYHDDGYPPFFPAQDTWTPWRIMSMGQIKSDISDLNAAPYGVQTIYSATGTAGSHIPSELVGTPISGQVITVPTGGGGYTKIQVLILDTPAMYIRNYVSNSWGNWVAIVGGVAATLTDANDAVRSGVYIPPTDGTAANYPTGASTNGTLTIVGTGKTPASHAVDGTLFCTQSYTTGTSVWVRTGVAHSWVDSEYATHYETSWSAWAEIAGGGGGNALPDQTTYTTFGSGKRLYVTDTEPTGSDIPLGSVWIGGDA